MNEMNSLNYYCNYQNEYQNKYQNEIKSYISATKLFNYCNDDILLDYLDKYGEELGYEKEKCPEEIEKIMSLGCLFETNIYKAIRNTSIEIVEVSSYDNWLEGYQETIKLINLGCPIIAQGYLLNHINKTKGRPDILIRSDYINLLKKDTLTNEEIYHNGKWYYLVIDIKMSNLSLIADGNGLTNSKLYKAYKVQLLVYNLGLSIIQNYCSPFAFILGRSSHNYDNSIMYEDCFNSLSRVDYSNKDSYCFDKLEKGLKWFNILEQLPLPIQISNQISNQIQNQKNELNTLQSQPIIEWDWEYIENKIKYLENLHLHENENNIGFTLRPNMKNKYDYKWKKAKKIIAYQREELTLLWNCGISKRNKALANGISNWNDFKMYCKKNEGFQNNIIYQILEINYPSSSSSSSSQVDLIYPNNKYEFQEDLKDLIPPREEPFIVLDFETLNNLNDDFSNLPEKGGCDMIFLCGITIVIPKAKLDNNINYKYEYEYEYEYEYRYFPFMINQLNLEEELKILIEILKLVKYLTSFLGYENIILNHWSNAEPVFFEKMLERHWDYLEEEEKEIIDKIEFNDILSIFKYQPIVIKGAFDFGLKNIARAMYNNGMIKTIWDNDLNGLIVMMKMNEYNKEAEKLDISLKDFEEVNEIIKYNMIDCQVLSEIIVYLQNKYLDN